MTGARLRRLRVEAGLSVVEVAGLTAVTPRAVGKLEVSAEVGPQVALRYLLAIDAVLQRRCALISEVRALVAEESNRLDERLRPAQRMREEAAVRLADTILIPPSVPPGMKPSGRAAGARTVEVDS
jgi:transcriptional regulator with XRE-family HTH domain